MVFHYIVNYAQMRQDVAAKMEKRSYSDKKEHWVVHDEVTDFIMDKIQGYALIRQSFMPLFEDLK